LEDKVQTLVSFYLLNKMLRYVGIILLVEFSKYLESFSRSYDMIRRKIYMIKPAWLTFLLNHRVHRLRASVCLSVMRAIRIE